MKKCIPVNLVTSVSMTNEDSNFPASQMLDNHPQVKARATGDSAVISANVSAGANGIFISSTNAESATVTVSSPHEAYFIDSSYFADDSYFVETGSIQTNTVIQTGVSTNIACTFTALTGPIEVQVDLSTATGQVLEVGTLTVGEIVEYSYSPQYGVVDGLVDNSTSIEMDSGAFYSDFEEGDVVRSLSYGQMLPRDEAFAFLQMAKRYNRTNMPMWITGLTGTDWLVFGRLDATPSATHSYPNFSQVQIKIIEAI